MKVSGGAKLFFLPRPTAQIIVNVGGSKIDAVAIPAGGS
jgi:hypothetical protein